MLLIKLIWADMKSCSEKPVIVNSDLYLVEIIDIDENKNSVSIQVDLWTYWKDPLLASSNNSAK